MRQGQASAEVPKSTARSGAAVIDRLQRKSAAEPTVLSLAGGLPAPDLFPRQIIASACVAVLEHSGCAALQYGWPEGDPELRSWVSRRLQARGATVQAEDVVITSGAQQAIALSIDALLEPGGTIHVDAESYPSALDLFRARGLKLTTSLAAEAAYVMPGVSNPRGTDLAPDKLEALLRSNLPILADEAYSELRFDGRAAPLLLARAGERTFHIGTFSKTLCPGFRIGWLVPPRAYREKVLRLKADADLQANSLSQSILSETLRTWDYDAHLARARNEYARRAERLLRALRRHLPAFRVQPAEGGFSLFLEADRAGDDTRFLAAAIEEGVSFDPGRSFRAHDTGAPLTLRLCHSNLRVGVIDEAVRRLARAWAAFSNHHRASRRSRSFEDA
jgi:2-aminoadipate transaminase